MRNICILILKMLKFLGKIGVSARIGVPNKGVWTEKKLRFFVEGNRFVSGMRKADMKDDCFGSEIFFIVIFVWKEIYKIEFESKGDKNSFQKYIDKYLKVCYHVDMNKIYKPNEFGKMIGRTVNTLQRWDREGILKARRTPTNRRYYTEEDYYNIMGIQQENVENQVNDVIIYARVSNQNQKRWSKKSSGIF